MEIKKAVIVPKPLWGEERIITNNELYCAKELHIKEGFRFSLQYHKLKDETHYIAQGVVVMNKGIDGKVLESDEVNQIILQKGDIVRIPPFTAHRCGSLEGTSIIYETSTTHFDEDTYKLENQIEGFTNKIPLKLMQEFRRQYATV
jgi:mannose-6-phosphate isomerase-like protein (cupin superfamily)